MIAAGTGPRRRAQFTKRQGRSALVVLLAFATFASSCTPDVSSTDNATAVGQSSLINNGLCGNSANSRLVFGSALPVELCFDSSNSQLVVRNRASYLVNLGFRRDAVSLNRRENNDSAFWSRFVRDIEVPGLLVIPPNGKLILNVNRSISASADLTFWANADLFGTVRSEIAKTLLSLSGSVGGAVSFSAEIFDSFAQALSCWKRNNWFGDIGCTSELTWDVTFALGRGAFGLLGGNVATIVDLLFQIKDRAGFILDGYRYYGNKFTLKHSATSGGWSKRSRIVGNRSSNYRFRYSNVETCYYSRLNQRQGCVLGTTTGGETLTAADVPDLVGYSPDATTIVAARQQPQAGFGPATYWSPADVASPFFAFDANHDGFDDLLKVEGEAVRLSLSDNGVTGGSWDDLGSVPADTLLVGVADANSQSPGLLLAKSSGELLVAQFTSSGVSTPTVLVPADPERVSWVAARDELGATSSVAAVAQGAAGVSLDLYTITNDSQTISALENRSVILGPLSQVDIGSIAVGQVASTPAADVSWFDPSTSNLVFLPDAGEGLTASTANLSGMISPELVLLPSGGGRAASIYASDGTTTAHVSIDAAGISGVDDSLPALIHPSLANLSGVPLPAPDVQSATSLGNEISLDLPFQRVNDEFAVYGTEVLAFRSGHSLTEEPVARFTLASGETNVNLAGLPAGESYELALLNTSPQGTSTPSSESDGGLLRVDLTEGLVSEAEPEAIGTIEIDQPVTNGRDATFRLEVDEPADCQTAQLDLLSAGDDDSRDRFTVASGVQVSQGAESQFGVPSEATPGDFILIATCEETGRRFELADVNVVAGSRPTAEPASITTPFETASPVELLGTDPDGDDLTFSLLSEPLHGQIIGTPPHLTYIPNAGFSGPDSFEFLASDGALHSDPGIVSVTVLPVTPPSCNESGSEVSIEFSGDLRLESSGAACGTGFKIKRDAAGLVSLRGSGTFQEVDGREVNISVDSSRILFWIFGTITVEDSALGGSVTTPILFLPTPTTDGKTATLEATWFTLKDFKFSQYHLKAKFSTE